MYFIAPPSVQSTIIVRGAFVNNTCIRFTNIAKNLGILIDDVSFEGQVNQVVKSCFAFIKDLYSINMYLTKAHVKSLICSYVFLRIDYCNALYYGINGCLTNKLQYVQNAAARLIQRKFKMPSLEDVYNEMHWLRVKERTVYKILLIAHKSITGKAPLALCNMFVPSTHQRLSMVQETRVHSKFGERAFGHIGPKLWNLLPQKLKAEKNTETFKKLLKTFMFRDGHSLILRSKIS